MTLQLNHTFHVCFPAENLLDFTLFCPKNTMIVSNWNASERQSEEFRQHLST